MLSMVSCRRRSRWLIAILLMLVSPSVRAADERDAWEYTGGFGRSWFVHEGGQKWMIYRGDGRTFLYLEENRTPEHIELRGPQTKLLVRLADKQFDMRRSADEPWKKSANGQWIDPGNLPQHIQDATDEYQIRVVYFVPTNRKPAQQYEERIRVILSMVAELIHNDLRSQRFHPRPLPFEQEEGEIRIRLIQGKESADYYTKDAWPNTEIQAARIHEELLQQIGDPSRQLTIVFAETYSEELTTEAWKGHIARGAALPPEGGLIVYSSWLLKNTFSATNREDQIKLFFDKAKVPGRKAFGSFVDDSPVYEFVEDGFGSIVQQLGHALGCPHDYRDSRNLMGHGFRTLRANFAPRTARLKRGGFSTDNARMLMCSRYLATDLTLDDYNPPRVTMQLLRRGRNLTAVIDASDETGLRAMLLRNLNGRTLSVIHGRKLAGDEQQIRQRLTAAFLKETNLELEALVADEGGNVSRASAKLKLK